MTIDNRQSLGVAISLVVSPNFRSLRLCLLCTRTDDCVCIFLTSFFVMNGLREYRAVTRNKLQICGDKGPFSFSILFRNDFLYLLCLLLLASSCVYVTQQPEQREREEKNARKKDNVLWLNNGGEGDDKGWGVKRGIYIHTTAPHPVFYRHLSAIFILFFAWTFLLSKHSIQLPHWCKRVSFIHRRMCSKEDHNHR